MSMINGVVEGVSTKYDKYSININGGWYSTKMEWARCKPVAGDTVEFDDAGGKYTKNMRIVSAGSGSAAPSAPPSGSSTPPTAAIKKGGFPMAIDDTYRSINRQNALTNACNVLSTQGSAGIIDPLGADDIIALAREFEAYTTGDIERYAAEASIDGAFNPEG